MFTLRRPAVYVPLLLLLVVAMIAAMAVLSHGGSGGLLSAGRANCPPVARNDAAFTRPSEPVTVDVLANDSDVDGDHLQFQVINVTAGEADVDFKGAGPERLVYTPSTPDGTQAKVLYRVTDPSGDVSTATLTVAITQAGVMPTGLESASVNDRNGDVLEARCIRAAKGSPKTTPETATTSPGAASDAVASDAFQTDATGNAPVKGSNSAGSADRGSRAASGSDSSNGNGNGDGNGSDTRSDNGGASPPETAPQSQPPTTQPPTTQPPPSNNDPSPCHDRQSCQDWANGDGSTNTTAPDGGGD
jgi:hypothetical protein